MTLIKLTDEELVLLDGRCSEKVQAEVEAAKLRIKAVAKFANLDPAHAAFIADAVAYAAREGHLGFRWEQGRWCKLCKRDPGYAKYKSTTRYHRKGDENRNKPLTMPLVDLVVSRVTVKGHVSLGCCHLCWDAVKPELTKALSGIRAQVHSAITGEKPKWLRYENRTCKKCGWTGHEGQMRRLRTLMGDGYYFGGCPQCDGANVFMGGTVIDRAEGFTVVEAPPPENPKPETPRDLPGLPF